MLNKYWYLFPLLCSLVFSDVSISSKNYTMLVSGKRLDSGVSYLLNKAADTDVLYSANISDRAVQSAAKLVDLLPGYSLESFGIGQKYQIKSRGYADKSGLVVFVDGVKQNDFNNDQVLWEAIPVQDIERIEFIRGGNSVVYGIGAVAGVINIITKKKAQDYSGKIFINSSLGYHYQQGLNIYFPIGALDSRLFYKEGKGTGTRVNSNFDNLNVSYGLAYSQLENLSLDYSHKYLKSYAFENAYPKYDIR